MRNLSFYLYESDGLTYVNPLPGRENRISRFRNFVQKVGRCLLRFQFALK